MEKLTGGLVGHDKRLGVVRWTSFKSNLWVDLVGWEDAVLRKFKINREYCVLLLLDP